MRCRSKLSFATIIYAALIFAPPGSGICAGQADISFSKTDDTHEVGYTSGKTVYIEALVGDRWVGRSWNADNGTGGAKEAWQDDAFGLRVSDVPQNEDPGKWLSGGWHWLGAKELAKTDRSARHFVVDLASSVLPVKVRIHTLLDGTPVLTRWLEVTDTSPKKPLALGEVFPWSGRLWDADAPIRLGHSLRREVFWEGWFGWNDLVPGANVFRNDTDRLWDDPYFLLQNESNGEYFFGQLAWAANYEMEFNKDRGLTFRIGPVARQSLRVISAGETVTTPAVHLGYVKGDFDAAVQAMHDHLRRSAVPTLKPERAYRSQYLIPEDQPWSVVHGDNFNVANLSKCADVAAAAGIEAFILDGPTWLSGYGDWLSVKKKWFPNGVGPLVDHIHQNRMLFGAYFETEGGVDGNTRVLCCNGASIGFWKDSKVFQEHPEWFDNLNLNLAVPEAAAYLEEELGRIIEFYKLDLYRHDQNGIVFFPPGPGAGETLRDGRFIDSNYWRHYEALDHVFERVHTKYPDLILQSAAAGNFRLDLSTAGVFHEHFASDQTAWQIIYRTMSGMSVFLPPEILVAANGMAGPNQPDQVTILRSAYALGNTPMIFNSMLPKSTDELPAETRDRFLHYANLYKSFIRPLLPTCKVYHHAPVNATGGVETGDWFAMEFASPERTRGWATVIRLSKTEMGEYLLKPRGLDAAKRYRVTFDNTGKTETFEGERLMREGLAIRPPTNPASELLLFEAQ